MKIVTHKSPYELLDDAGYDLYACLEMDDIIYPGETLKVPTGIALEIPEGYFGAVYARSGLATKQGLRRMIYLCANSLNLSESVPLE